MSMTKTNAKKQYKRLTLRVTPEVREDIVLGAKLHGRSINEFIVGSAVQAAERVIKAAGEGLTRAPKGLDEHMP
jgi:uncharacterized protein (DUF1778 family)